MHVQSLKCTPSLTICARSFRVFRLPASKSIRCQRCNSIQMRHPKLLVNLKMAAVINDTASQVSSEKKLSLIKRNLKSRKGLKLHKKWYLCYFFLFVKLRHMTAAILRFPGSLGCLYESTSLAQYTF